MVLISSRVRNEQVDGGAKKRITHQGFDCFPASLILSSQKCSLGHKTSRTSRFGSSDYNKSLWFKVKSVTRIFRPIFIEALLKADIYDNIFSHRHI